MDRAQGHSYRRPSVLQRRRDVALEITSRCERKRNPFSRYGDRRWFRCIYGAPCDPGPMCTRVSVDQTDITITALDANLDL